MMTSSERTRLKKLLDAFLANCHIPPDMTAAWLSADLNWTEATKNPFGPNFRAFELQGRQVQVPVKDEYADYSRRLIEMLEEIADIEQGFTLDYYRSLTCYVVSSLELIEDKDID